MKRSLLAAAVAALVAAGPVTAQASDDYCNNVPMSEWQPKQALQQKLEAEGWKVRRIKTDDGCYEAYAIDPNGDRVEAYFNPKTLELVRKKRDD